MSTPTRTPRLLAAACAAVAAVAAVAAPAPARAAQAPATSLADVADRAVTTEAPAAAHSPSADPAQHVRRLALVAAANDGGPSRAALRYAVSDARSVAALLRATGGVAEGDLALLVEPDRRALQGALAGLEARVTAARADATRVELLVYYSGHSDESGLLLGAERFGYDELRGALESTGADVRVAILDSCAAGAMTRTKGGVRRPAFLMDLSVAVKGHAYLASSSADEAAQESDRIGASFFTHYLLSGLRGAADSSGDGRVTLNEAYQYAYGETVARTQATRAGVQHPAYDIELAGTGDLVITDLHGAAATLVLPEAEHGRYFIFDAGDRLVVEVVKPAGRPMRLSLDPGIYTVRVERDGGLFAARVTLHDGEATELGADAYTVVAREATASRGDAPATEVLDDDAAGGPAAPGAAPPHHYTHIPFYFALVPGVSSDGEVLGQDVQTNFALSLIAARVGRLDGVGLSAGANWVDGDVHGMTGSSIGNYSGGDTHGLAFSGGVNWVGGELDGGAFSSAFNHVAGAMPAGVMAAAGANSVLGDARGAQLAAGLNWAREHVTGAQAAAGLNVAGAGFRGAQLAAGLNVARDESQGAQLAIVNVGGDVTGAQVGLVNIATGHVRGLQLGLFNYADDLDGAPIGLVSVVAKGTHTLDVWTSDVGALNVGARLGGRRVYSLVYGAGKTGGDHRGGFGLGLGVHFEPGPLFLDVDAANGNFWARAADGATRRTSLATARLLVGWPLAEHLAPFAGPTFNVLYPNDGSRLSPAPTFVPAGAQRRLDGGRVAMWPGFVAGVRF